MTPNAKQNIGDLAVFGGTPAFGEPVHVGRPNAGNREKFIDRVKLMFDRRWFTNRGPFVVDLEKRLATLFGVKHCIAMCNATVALEIAARALGLQGEVIVPSMTFIASAHCLQWQQITPVFCDIDPRTHNIDPARIESLITPRTSGIMGVHLWGRPCQVEALERLAERHGLKLLFDAAHAFACSHDGRMIGGGGDCEVFSFHATKMFNTFEGGAVATNDDELAAKIRLMQNFGFKDYDQVIYIGTNGKMSEISAAMGLTLLEDLEQLVAVNYLHYKQYQRELAGIPGLRLTTYDETERCNYHYIILELDESQAGLRRDDLVRLLHAENVLARRYFYPGCHRMEPYRSYFPHAGLLLPHTEALVERVVSLPSGTAVSTEDVKRLCALIRFAVAKGPEISERLAQRQEPMQTAVA
jgi:dTDP-4-amino-4,6-dideoxygalactose transaminase